ncbi:hypothetical protein BC628DRAFT_1417555 [Trametes gibbosa]|uniref:Zinc finger protein 214 n=1 Tax=Trametes gibbosa TaxID=160864 RepID=A0A6B9KKQ8_9APHY|nr:hypothetical protein BC628DRAFT_1417555 [Trametes gibbosa]QHA24587.1 zinc finger protein 214 [Trametes gibbosa]
MEFFDFDAFPSESESIYPAGAGDEIAKACTIPPNLQEMPTRRDIEAERRLNAHLDTLKEIASQWPFATPWSNSLGFDPKVILGPGPEPSEPIIAPHVDPKRPPKRRRTEAAAAAEEPPSMIASHPRVIVETPSPPAPPEPPVSEKARGKRPAPPEEEGELQGADDSDGDYVPQPRVIRRKPRVRAAAPATVVPDDENEDTSDAAHLRCRWGDCAATFAHNDGEGWKSHLQAFHFLKGGPDPDGCRYTCQWDKCGASIKALFTLERHVETTHIFVGGVACPKCHKRFSRADAKVRHLRKCGV